MQDGCTGYVPSSRNYTAPFQGCGLDFQSDSSQGVGQNVVALPAPGYIGGERAKLLGSASVTCKWARIWGWSQQADCSCMVFVAFLWARLCGASLEL